MGPETILTVANPAEGDLEKAAKVAEVRAAADEKATENGSVVVFFDLISHHTDAH